MQFAFVYSLIDGSGCYYYGTGRVGGIGVLGGTVGVNSGLRGGGGLTGVLLLGGVSEDCVDSGRS